MKIISFLISLLIYGCFTLSDQAAEAPALPISVSPTNSLIRFIGRFDFRNASGPSCSWPASTVAVRFQGADLNVKLYAMGHDFWQVAVDGKPADVLELQEGEHLYRVVSGLTDGVHSVELVKATEGLVGMTQLRGLEMSQGGMLFACPPAKRRIEVIGDSISAGYGNEAANARESFTPRTENAYFTYGAIAARQVGADYLCIAFSGRKMWPDNTVPELYDRTLTVDPESFWDYSRWTPDVILINLATNDFWQENPDKDGWIGAYEAFIERLRKLYPKSVIYCAIGTMLDDSSERKPYTTARACLKQVVSDRAAKGDANVHLVDFGTQDPKNGFGANSHPSQKTHELMAQKFVAILHSDLGWQ